MSSFITSLRLTNFRNIEHLRLDIQSRINLISGDNGIGKTNLLDALARINIMRGLKNQTSRECVNILKPYYGWGVTVKFDNDDVVQYGRTKQQDKMIYHFNHQLISHDSLRQKVPLLWLSPVGEKLFTEEHKDIRRYIDNLISMIFPDYADYRIAYDKALKQRMKLLQENSDIHWITVLEFEISENAYQIIYLRDAFLKIFNQSYAAIINQTSDGFPDFSLNIECQSKNIQTIEHYQALLSQSRIKDTASGRSLFGIHRNKISVMHLQKEIDIYYCSTGEQKAILSHILFVMNHALQSKGFNPPIMLFDDALAHYDKNRIEFFYNYMQNHLNNQFFLTNTEFSNVFSGYSDIKLYPFDQYLKCLSDTLF